LIFVKLTNKILISTKLSFQGKLEYRWKEAHQKLCNSLEMAQTSKLASSAKIAAD